MVRESVKNAMEQFTFGLNERNTWIQVRSMIENYLMNQWRLGALQGSKPEDAYFVRVGLGQTMTEQDIVEGRMIVEIGLAVIRPAGFIIIKITQKMSSES